MLTWKTDNQKPWLNNILHLIELLKKANVWEVPTTVRTRCTEPGGLHTVQLENLHNLTTHCNNQEWHEYELTDTRARLHWLYIVLTARANKFEHSRHRTATHAIRSQITAALESNTPLDIPRALELEEDTIRRTGSPHPLLTHRHEEQAMEP